MNRKLVPTTLAPRRSFGRWLTRACAVTPLRQLVAGAICIAALGASLAYAEDAKDLAKPAASSLGDLLTASGIKLTGYVDASYEHLNSEGAFANGTPDRTFDYRKDSFSLHQVAVTLAYQPKEGFGAFAHLIAGQDPDVFAPYDSNPGAHSKFDFPHAYVQYATGALTVIGGRYVTLAGAETIDPRTNFNFSRSILFGFAIPFAHTGVRATVAASDQLTLVFGVTNGWDDLKDTNSAKTLELGVGYTPTKAVSIAAQGYFGRERVAGLVPTGQEGMRKLIDVAATWNVTDALSLVLNYDWGRQQGAAGSGLTAGNADTARWNGLAGYVNYQIDDHYRISLRAEYFDDKDAYRTGYVQKWKEGTLTFGYAPVKAFELRLEARYDKAGGNFFLRSPSITDVSNNQTSVAIEGLYKF